MKKLIAITILLAISFFALTFAYSMYQNINAKKMENLSENVFKNIQLEILDATGEKHDSVLRFIKNFFIMMNFDVVYAGKVPDTIKYTYVVDRRDSTMTEAKIVARLIDVSKVYYSMDEDSVVNVSVILGKDYKRIVSKVEEKYGFGR